MSFRITLPVFGVAVLTASVLLSEQPSAAESDPPMQRPVARLTMAAKLKFASVILEGLSFEDFERIADGANSMSGVNDLEAFARRRDPAYTAQLNHFRSATESVLDAAERRNLDAAASAYSQLTMSCVNCHKTLRRPAK